MWRIDGHYTSEHISGGNGRLDLPVRDWQWKQLSGISASRAGRFNADEDNIDMTSDFKLGRPGDGCNHWRVE